MYMFKKQHTGAELAWTSEVVETSLKSWFFFSSWNQQVFSCSFAMARCQQIPALRLPQEQKCHDVCNSCVPMATGTGNCLFDHRNIPGWTSYMTLYGSFPDPCYPPECKWSTMDGLVSANDKLMHRSNWPFLLESDCPLLALNKWAIHWHSLSDASLSCSLVLGICLWPCLCLVSFPVWVGLVFNSPII